MLSYFIEVSICWALFWLLYRLLLSRETFFALNRAYLLLAAIAGLLLPLLRMQVATPVAVANPGYWLETVTIGASTSPAAAPDLRPLPTSSFTWLDALLWLYWAGVALMSLRLAYGLIRIALLRARSTQHWHQGYQVMLTDYAHLPFSFLGTLYWSRHIALEGEEAEVMLRHEQTHIRELHSLDVLFFELLSIAFWCSPFIYALKKDLRAVHEYLADAQVLQHTSKKQYGQLLLRHHSSGPSLAFSHSFSQTQLKKRFVMMIKSPSRRLALLKYSLALPLAAFMLLLFAASPVEAQEAPAPPPPPPPKVVFGTPPVPPPPPPALNLADPNNTDEVYKVVDEMPTFPGCEDKIGQDDYQSCAQTAMLKFIYENIRYPEEAKEQGIQGTVVVRFIVEKDGSLSDIAVVRDIGAGCGEEVQYTIASMPKWNPGKQNGETVRVQFNLPVRFKIDEEEAAQSDKGKLEVKNLSVAPNPGTGLFLVSLELPNTAPLRMRVYDIQGTLHQTTEVEADASLRVQHELNITHLQTGTYLLQLEQEGKVKTIPLVLKRD
jgi:TonB family protein